MNRISGKFLFFIMLGCWFIVHTDDADDPSYQERRLLQEQESLLIQEYVKEKKLDQTAEYKKLAKERHADLDVGLGMDSIQDDVVRETDEMLAQMSQAQLKESYEAYKIQYPSLYADDPFEELRDPKHILQQTQVLEMCTAKLEQLKVKYKSRIQKNCSEQPPKDQLVNPYLLDPNDLTEEERSKLFPTMTSQCFGEVMREYVKEKELDKTTKFKEKHSELDAELQKEAFEREIKREATEAVKVMSDADLRAYCEEHKNEYEFEYAFEYEEPFTGESAKYANLDAPGMREAVKQLIIQHGKSQELRQEKIEELKKKFGKITNKDACTH